MKIDTSKMNEKDPIDLFIEEHKLGDIASALFDALYDSDWDGPETIAELRAEASEYKQKSKELENLLNTPETKNFIEGVSIEAGHQRWRWGDEHDIRKTAADWFWTLGFLSQKAMTAIEAGDIDKAKHHTISSAALLANWHRQISREGLAK